MIKRGLVRTLIYDYMDDHDIDSSEKLITTLPDIYKWLKEEKKELPIDVTYELFYSEALRGYRDAELRSKGWTIRRF